MTHDKTGTRAEWLVARLALLDAEKELTRRSDALARQRLALPWVRVDHAYRFETERGSVSLSDLFRGRSQLLVHHFMFGPDYAAGCPSCSSMADDFNGSFVHLENHDVAFTAVSRAPLAKVQAFKQRMDWNVPWASAPDGAFNADFHVAFTEEQLRKGPVDYNYQPMDVRPALNTGEDGVVGQIAAMTQTGVASYLREMPGMSAFVLEEGVVHHTFSTYARGLDGLWGMYQWLDRAPRGRNEQGVWWRHHDQYEPR